MVLFNALSAENGQVVGAVEVLDPLFMILTQQAVNTLFIFKIDISKDTVSFNDFIQNVEVQRQFIHTLNLFDKFSANWASHTIIVVESAQTLRTKSVSAVDHNSWDFFAHIKFAPAVIAIIEATTFVVGAQQVLALPLFLLLFMELLLLFSLFSERLSV
jgi:hypothetical protein